MENSIENRISMFEKTQGFLNLSVDETTDVVDVGILKSELDINIVSILELARIALIKTSGITKDKQAKRTDLKMKTLKLSTAMTAWQSVDHMVHLEQKTDKTPAAMTAMRESDFYVYCKLVIKQAGGVMADLAPFGVSPTNLAEAQTTSDKYLKVLPAPKNQILARTKALEELKIRVAQTDLFLKEKLDKVMRVYITGNPSLYSGYMKSRKIDDTGSKKNPD